jgi:hypothetical protein
MRHRKSWYTFFTKRNTGSACERADEWAYTFRNACCSDIGISSQHKLSDAKIRYFIWTQVIRFGTHTYKPNMSRFGAHYYTCSTYLACRTSRSLPGNGAGRPQVRRLDEGVGRGERLHFGNDRGLVAVNFVLLFFYQAYALARQSIGKNAQPLFNAASSDLDTPIPNGNRCLG